MLAGTTACGRRGTVRAIWKSSIDDQRLGAIHLPNMNQCTIFIRSAPVAHERIQISRIRIIVTPAGAVHLAQTSHRKSLVLTLGLGRVGPIVEAVIVVVRVIIYAVEPEAREDSERCSGQHEG